MYDTNNTHRHICCMFLKYAFIFFLALTTITMQWHTDLQLQIIYNMDNWLLRKNKYINVLYLI